MTLMTDIVESDDAEMIPLAHVPTLEEIQRLEAVIGACEQVEMPPVHHFANGLYGREIRIPAGTVLTGKQHATEHLNILAEGEITVWTEGGMKRLKAPHVMVSSPGTKRVGYAHTDTVWITVHASKETDLEKLEAELIVPETPAITAEESPCLGSQ